MEQDLVDRYLGGFIRRLELPGKSDIDALLTAQPELNRTWRNVKDYCRNRILARHGVTASMQSEGSVNTSTEPRHFPASTDAIMDGGCTESLRRISSRRSIATEIGMQICTVTISAILLKFENS